MTNLRKGQKVRITFVGVLAVAHRSGNAVCFESGDGRTSLPLSWSARLAPKVEILNPGFGDGDVGVLTRTKDGVKVSVVFRKFNNNGAEGWYGLLDGAFRAVANSAEVELVLRGDGTLPDAPDPEPEPAEEDGEEAYVPQHGDVAFYLNDFGVKQTAFYCKVGFSRPGFWRSMRDSRVAEIHKDAAFELVIRDSVLQEGVGLGG